MIGWLDTASGASGDMLLGALVDAGVDVDVIRAAVAAVAPEAVTLSAEPTRRGALLARRVRVQVADSHTHRGLGDVLDLLLHSRLDEATSRHAGLVFTRLAEAEAAVHGKTVDEVHFHEVGALDAIADVVGVCAGFVALGLDELHCSAVAVGSGSVETDHGRLSVPPPAVVQLLRGVATYAGPIAHEMCTPTGAALLRHWVTHWGPQPHMAVTVVGHGAGGRDLAEQANVVRLLLGEPADIQAGESVVLETNVDDFDPRLWPAILVHLLDLGASDAWLTPILMKKGRPAHTLSVLVRSAHAPDVRAAIYAETSAIGMREYPVSKHELEREIATVSVGEQAIRIKIARAGGAVVNVQPEYDDVARVARELGQPAKSVLASAIAAANALLAGRGEPSGGGEPSAALDSALRPD